MKKIQSVVVPVFLAVAILISFEDEILQDILEKKTQILEIFDDADFGNLDETQFRCMFVVSSVDLNKTL